MGKDVNELSRAKALDYDMHPDFPKSHESVISDVQHLNELCHMFKEIAGSKDPADQLTLRAFGADFRRFWLNLQSQAQSSVVRAFYTELGPRVEKALTANLIFLNQVSSSARTKPSLARGVTASHRFHFGELNDRDTSAILNISSRLIAELRRRAESGKLTRHDLSVGRGSEIRQIIAVLNAAWLKDGTLEIISKYSGTEMVVGAVGLELSDSRSDWWRHRLPIQNEPQTMYAHLDEAISRPKAIVYLSHVDHSAGPTSCYQGVFEEMELNPVQDALGRVVMTVADEGSLLHGYLDDVPYHQVSGSGKFRSLFMTIPPELRFNSHLGWEVIAGSDLEAQMIDREVYLLGGAGTYIVFDGGRLFHRGGLIQCGQRIALQVVFEPKSELRLRKRALNKLAKVQLMYMGPK